MVVVLGGDGEDDVKVAVKHSLRVVASPGYKELLEPYLAYYCSMLAGDHISTVFTTLS